VKEQVQDGVTGILASEISGPALAEALRRAVEDDALRKRVGEAARALAAQEYEEAVFFERHQQLYSEILGAWRARP
jgi:glycosyltransferase involved in cell wall biosynthesis